jgi:hypothetical protein
VLDLKVGDKVLVRSNENDYWQHGLVTFIEYEEYFIELDDGSEIQCDDTDFPKLLTKKDE